MDERPDNSEQLMDILLVMDQEKKTIQAVSGVKDGELQTKNPLEDNNDLLRVDRHGDMFSNFFSNLWNQLKDPTRFHFFRVPEEDVQRVAADFQQTVQTPTPEGQARMAQYEVQHPAQAQQQGEQQAQPAAGQQQQQPTDAPQQQPQYKYDVEKIDWNSLANLGIKREQIEQNGMLDQMLRGFQTDKTVRVYFNLDSISHANDSQLSLREAPDGRVVVCSHGILDPQKLQQQFFGHTFTPDEVARLKKGEAVVCKFQTKAKEGQKPKTYEAPIQFNAAKMQLELLFNDRAKLAMDAHKELQKQTANQEVPKTFRKQELTEKSQTELAGGGTVKVSGLKDQNGKPYQGYITWQPGQKYPAFMFPKDYKTALEEGRVKPAVENEVQVAVNSEGKTNEATKSLKEALQSAQTRPTGEQKEQQDRKQEQKEDKKEDKKQKQEQDKPKPRQRKAPRL